MGVPEGASSDSPVPAVVLVHGGLGTAFHKWVSIWLDRGYAAIAIDHCGSYPLDREKNDWTPLPRGGPRGCGGYKYLDQEPSQHWQAHAIANIMRAHSLLANQEGVDARRIALNGISWGGVLTNLTMAYDQRFVCAVALYGCGFLDQSPIIGAQLDELGDERKQAWVDMWDPQHFIPRIKRPICAINGVHDRHFIPPNWQKSCSLAVAETRWSMQLELAHSHEAGWAPQEIYHFIDHHLKGSTPIPQWTPSKISNNCFTAEIEGIDDGDMLAIHYTLDSDQPWPEKNGKASSWKATKQLALNSLKMLWRFMPLSQVRPALGAAPYNSPTPLSDNGKEPKSLRGLRPKARITTRDHEIQA